MKDPRLLINILRDADAITTVDGIDDFTGSFADPALAQYDDSAARHPPGSHVDIDGEALMVERTEKHVLVRLVATGELAFEPAVARAIAADLIRAAGIVEGKLPDDE